MCFLSFVLTISVLLSSCSVLFPGEYEGVQPREGSYKAKYIKYDPVCGSKIDIKKDDNYIILKHKGISYYFDSKECLQKFKENPEKYIDKNKNEHYSRKMSDSFAKTLGYLALSGIALFLFLPYY